MPIYANEILQVGARGYGVLSASLEAGALVTSLVLVWLPPIRRAGRALMIAVGVFGVATIVFGLSRSFPLSVLAYMIAGAADQISVVMRSTAIQPVSVETSAGAILRSIVSRSAYATSTGSASSPSQAAACCASAVRAACTSRVGSWAADASAATASPVRANGH